MQYLTPVAKAGVRASLGEQTLVDVCTWALEVRGDQAYRWASPLHYANVAPGRTAFNLQRDCPERGCVVSAVIKYPNCSVVRWIKPENLVEHATTPEGKWLRCGRKVPPSCQMPSATAPRTDRP